ncbi:MAG: polysaccharide deacetylase family protein [Lachnospirales bacterium]
MKLLSSTATVFILGAAALASLNDNIKEIDNVQTAYVETIMPTTVIESTTEATTYEIFDTLKTSKDKRSWYFVYKNDHNTPGVQMGVDYKKYGAFYVGDTSEKKIYLTFDEGYEYGFTPTILDVLKSKGVKAAFFCTGDFLKKEPELVKRMVSEGHIVANHSYKHLNQANLSEEQIFREINDCEYEYKKITGEPMAKFFRPPEGAYTETSLAVVHNMGYKTIFWSFAHKDWEVNNQPGAVNAYNRIINGSHNGAIYLLHAVSQSNTEALSKSIDTLKSQGYTFGTLDELK